MAISAPSPACIYLTIVKTLPVYLNGYWGATIDYSTASDRLCDISSSGGFECIPKQMQHTSTTSLHLMRKAHSCPLCHVRTQTHTRTMTVWGISQLRLDECNVRIRAECWAMSNKRVIHIYGLLYFGTLDFLYRASLLRCCGCFFLS